MTEIARFETLVLGGGIIGAAALFFLARAGNECGLVERGRVGQGCTSHSGAVVRAFHLTPALSDAALLGRNHYTQFRRHVGVDCPFTQTGFLYFPRPDQIDAADHELRRMRGSCELAWLRPSEVSARFPEIRTETDAVYEPAAGYMQPREVVRGYIDAAVDAGARLYEGTAVEKLIRMNGRCVGVHTSAGALLADRVVVALGPETPSFLDREHVSHGLWAQKIQVDVRRGSGASTGHPAWIDDSLDLNGRPDGDRNFLVGFPTHDRNFSQGPTACSHAHSQVIEEMAKRRFDWMSRTTFAGSRVSFDCYSSDGTGLVGYVDEPRGVLVASGFSGGGFKLAPAVGERVARLVAEG